ncbi:MAG: sigma-70 family RNA polymerase sigma factor [Bacteroidales bacterium]|nr:sigma-70 family RNA polymerase sigma factor [Bacteroidales bacterium]NCA76130.1 sigma-70 family RNA polymerase sigma factor [Alphaproteobacteria bacterium]HPS50688.1 sigma-70 family RNA polymerase sigma factor [Bacteroidales bacterium]
MQAHVISDQDLIGRYLAGHESALEVLIRRHKNRVFAYILMVVKDKELAEDLFQDTFIKVINTFRSGTYKEEGKFIQWVMRIAHNLIIDYFRKSKRIPTVENSDEYDIFEKVRVPVESIEEQMITEQIHQDVKKLIDYLPREQKEVLVMRHYGEMSFKDIAEVTNVSINTALGRMRYALINLRKLVREKEVILTV